MIGLKSFLQKIPLFDRCGTVYLNHDGSILSWTKTQAEKNNLSQEAVVGKYYSILFKKTGYDSAFYDELLRTAERKGKHTVQLKFGNPHELIVSIKIEAIKDHRGTLIGYLLQQLKGGAGK